MRLYPFFVVSVQTLNPHNNKIHKNKKNKIFFVKLKKVNCESEDKSESFNFETIADWPTRFSRPFKIRQSPEFKKLKNHRKEIERRLLKKNGDGQMNLVRIINYLLPVILAG